jgi:hypothetical protein
MHPFFEGDGFNAVLRAVQTQPRRFKVYEKSGTLRISMQCRDVGVPPRKASGSRFQMSINLNNRKI